MTNTTKVLLEVTGGYTTTTAKAFNGDTEYRTTYDYSISTSELLERVDSWVEANIDNVKSYSDKGGLRTLTLNKSDNGWDTLEVDNNRNRCVVSMK